MAAQIGVADREFDRLGRKLGETLEGRAMTLLDRYYYKLTSRRPNSELTLAVLQRLLPDLKVGASYVADGGELDRFLAAEFERLSIAYDQVQSLDPSGLIHQPEALFLYERMTVDLLGVQRAWNTHFPPKELEALGVFFGFSFE